MSDSMKISHCPRCNNLFVKIKHVVCDRCIDGEDADYKKIDEVLDNHTGLGVEQVAQKAGVDPKCVLRMLDRGMIANEQVAKDVKCGQCGAPAISASQQLCSLCLVKLDQKFFKQIHEAKKHIAEQRSSDSVHIVLNAKRNQLKQEKHKKK